MIRLLLNFVKNISDKVWLGLGAILLFILCIAFSNWQAKQVSTQISDAKNKIEKAEAKLNTAYEIIDKMHTEHDAALEAANQALRERVEIYEAARDRICEAEKRINGNSKFCNQLVPDDIVRLWKEQDAERISKYPPSSTD